MHNMSFFTSADFTLGQKLLEVIFIIMGLVTLYTAFKNFRDKNNDEPLATALFWGLLGIVLAFGRWIPDKVNGLIIILMTIPAILGKVKAGTVEKPTELQMEERFQKIGMKIFIPALTMGLFAIIFAIFTDLGALVGIGVGVLVSMILLMVYDRRNTPTVFLNDSERMLSMVGPLSMLPMLLASLGAVFNAAGVGEVTAQLFSYVIPEGNVNVGIIAYALAMMLFTMIMGNAFAAITVVTVGIGAPFVLEYGADPVLIGMIGLTCGYCGTLLTPMAANFNIVPVAMLEMDDRMGVIKNQVVPALCLIVFQIVYMILFK